MNNKLITGVVGITLIVILSAFCLMPVVSDAQESIATETNTNEGYTLRYSEVGALEIYHANLLADEIELNGRIIQISETAPYFISDEFVLYSVHQSSGNFLGIWAKEVSALSTSEWTFVANDGVWTYTASGQSPITGTYSEMYCVDPNGLYGLYDTSASTLHLDADDYVYAFYNSTVGNWHMPPVKFDADSTSPSTTTFYGTGNTSYSNGTVTFTKSDDEPWYTLGSFVFAPNSSTNLSAQVVAPIHYSQSNGNESIANLVGVIPVFVLIAGLIFAVGFVRTRSQ